MTINFEQIKKNTVKAERQLKETDCVRFENPNGEGKRVLFAGNSITLHGILPEIGWYNEWGMAASEKDKDYVHRLIANINEKAEDAAYCISNVFMWERNYMDGCEKVFPIYQNASDFAADIIVVRFVENCPSDNFDVELFKKELHKFIDFLNSTGEAKVIISTSFWHHIADDALREYAKENNLPLVELGDLGERDDTKALGLFEHDGVANHPGDLGMEKIAERIFRVLKEYL